MKKFTLILLCIMQCALCINLSAATTVKSIAEIKQLADGTQITFQGEAMTTLHLSRFNSPIPGIFIQDDSTAIFLNHIRFNESNTWFNDEKYNGYKMNKGGTVVTSFTGTYRKATTTMPERIVLSDKDTETVQSGATGNPIPYINLTADELLANPSKYENMAITLTSPVLKEGKGVYSTTYSFQSGENKMPIHLSASIDGRSLPAAGTFTGICDKYNNNYQFLVFNRYDIQPTAFFSIVDMFNFVDDKNRMSIAQTEVEIIEPVLVNYVAQMLMSTNYYIQATNDAIPAQTSALCFTITSRNSSFSAQPGDSIKGLKGYYSKLAVVDGIYQGSMFHIQEVNHQNLQVVSSNNPISWQEQKVYNILQTPEKFESRLLSLPIGEFKNVNFIENGQTVERMAFIQFDGDLRKQYDTIRVQLVGGGDLTQYVGIPVAIMGILDMSEAISGGYPTILLRSEADIISNQTFDNLGAMFAQGKPRSSKVTYEIKNPLLVTYKYYAANTQGDNEHMCGLYLQDATGAILLKTGQPIEGVEPGDSIYGVKGSLQYDELGHQEHYFKGIETDKIVVKNSGNALLPKDVTLDAIVNDPMQYSAHLIKIENLEKTMKFGFSQGYPYETEFIYQNGATMNVLWTKLYENMTVVGVVEYGIMGHGLTIFPIEVENTTKQFDGVCTRIKDIKKLEEGTEFTYVGNATTTFTDYQNGILIEDYTGGILLRNPTLGDNGTANIKSGMQITNIKGKYYNATGDVMPYILMAEEDINNITINNTDQPIDYYSTDINVLNHFYSKYFVGKAVMLRQPTIIENDGAYAFVFSYYDAAGTETRVVMPALFKAQIDINAKVFVGYARKFDGVLTFVVVGNEEPNQSVDVEQLENTNVVYFANNTVVALNASAIEVYDINGRQLAKANADQLNISALNKGIYIVRTYHIDGACQTTKVIKY